MSALYGGAAWATVEAEIAKCEVVCANCHAVRTQERGAGLAYWVKWRAEQEGTVDAPDGPAELPLVVPKARIHGRPPVDSWA